MYPSSFAGIIYEIPGISADNFTDLNSRAYFLSHYHSDHIEGLNTPELLCSLVEHPGTFIYTSVPTAVIVHANNERLASFVKPLPMGSTTITIPADESKNMEELNVKLTLIPAGHCFGSVMFLFETVEKTVLFTGDFRMHSSDLLKYSSFFNQNGDPKIDALYVDTTFLHTTFSFPTRSESVQNLISELEKWLQKDDNNRVALHTSANFGYEYVFNEIYKKMVIQTYVNNSKWRFYVNLQEQVPGVTNDCTKTKIHLCNNYTEKKDHSSCFGNPKSPKYRHEKSSLELNYLYVHFSAMKWKDQITEQSLNRLSENRLDVCFATHCSRSELVYFVETLNAKKVVGFPEPYTSEKVKTPLKNNIVKVSSPKKRKIDSPLKKPDDDIKLSREKVARVFRL